MPCIVSVIVLVYILFLFNKFITHNCMSVGKKISEPHEPLSHYTLPVVSSEGILVLVSFVQTRVNMTLLLITQLVVQEYGRNATHIQIAFFKCLQVTKVKSSAC